MFSEAFLHSNHHRHHRYHLPLHQLVVCGRYLGEKEIDSSAEIPHSEFFHPQISYDASPCPVDHLHHEQYQAVSAVDVRNLTNQMNAKIIAPSQADFDFDCVEESSFLILRVVWEEGLLALVPDRRLR